METIREVRRLAGLLPCPFCGGEAELHINVPVYGLTGAWVECCECKARGRLGHVAGEVYEADGALTTPVTPATIERGKREAVRSWNSRWRAAV